MSILRAIVAAPALALLFALQVDAGILFTPLGDLSGGVYYSRASAVSNDGLTVVGESDSAFGTVAFEWRNGQMSPVGDFPSGYSHTYAASVSDDGSVIVGHGGGSEAIRWEGSATTVISAPPYGTRATAISGDGRFVVGQLTGASQFFTWDAQTQTLQSTGPPSGYIATYASDISSDGSVIVGHVQPGSWVEAARWDNGALSVLGGFGAGLDSAALAVSGDGSVVVGQAQSGAGTQAVRWDGAVMTTLWSGTAIAASWDGSTIVGRDHNDMAIFWTEDLGAQNLRDYLVSQGVTSLDGWSLQQANGVSGDGSVIVGYGRNPDGRSEAWMINLQAEPAEIPEPPAVWLFAIGIFVVAIKKRTHKVDAGGSMWGG